MNDLKNSIVEGLADICDKAYQLEEALHPLFLREAWGDQVDVARAIVGNSASIYDSAMAQGFSEQLGVSKQVWAGDILEKNHSFITARIQLAGVYKEAAASILSAPDEHLVATLEGLRPAAIAAATQVGSTEANDAVLTQLINNWCDCFIDLIEPLDLEEDEIA